MSEISAKFAAGLLEVLDKIAADLAQLRADIAGCPPAQQPAGKFENLSNLDPPCDPQAQTSADPRYLSAGDPELADRHLVETSAAAERFGMPIDRVRRWCREGCGRKKGGRQMASLPKFRRRLRGD